MTLPDSAMLPFSVLVPPAKFSVPALVSGLLLKLCVPPSICSVAPAAVVKLPLWVPPRPGAGCRSAR